MQNGIPELPKDCWISRAFEYLKNKCKTPDSLIFWTLFSFAGASMKDRIYFDLAGKRIYPNFPLLLIGPSGGGKTGAINACKNLFEDCLPFEIPENCTPESFFKEMANNNSNCIWIIPELADVFGQKDYQKGSIAKITRMLDNPKDLSVSRMKSDEVVKISGYALLNIIGASTFEWLIKYTESSASQGGFLPRFQIAFTDEQPKYVENPERDYEVENVLREELQQMLFPLEHTRLILNDKVKDKLREIYDLAANCSNQDQRPYYERMTENFLRTLMILQFFLRNVILDENQLNTTSIQLAFDISKSFVFNGLRITSCIIINNNNNIDTSFLRAVINKFNKNIGKRISYFSIYNGLHIPARKVEEVVRSLNTTNWIDWDGGTGKQGMIKVKTFIPFDMVIDPDNCYYVEEAINN